MNGQVIQKVRFYSAILPKVPMSTISSGTTLNCRIQKTQVDIINLVPTYMNPHALPVFLTWYYHINLIRKRLTQSRPRLRTHYLQSDCVRLSRLGLARNHCLADQSTGEP